VNHPRLPTSITAGLLVTALAGAEENVPFQEAKKAFIDAGAGDGSLQ
jgi:hypothetical protein